MANHFGVVEGFYWKPEDEVNGESGEFSHQSRSQLISFMGKKGLDSYLYDPKILREGQNGIYERAYNPKLIGDVERWKENFQAARQRQVGFSWGIAPGPYSAFMSYHPGWKEKVSGIYSVIEKVLRLGASSVTLLLDDSPSADFPEELAKQAYLANRISEIFPGHLAALCPAKYCGSKPELEEAHKILDDMLAPGIKLIFTGPAAWCHSIKGKDVPELISGRKYVLWDNWMASDTSKPERLELMPPQKRGAGLFDNIDGYLLNLCFPVERVIPLVSAVGEISNHQQRTPELDEMIEATSRDWAGFLGVAQQPLKKLIERRAGRRQERIAREEYEEITRKWPALGPVFESEA